MALLSVRITLLHVHVGLFGDVTWGSFESVYEALFSVRIGLFCMYM